MTEAKNDPLVGELLELGNELRLATVRRAKAKAKENAATEARRVLMEEWLAVAQRTREAVFVAAERGYSTPTIAEILGVNEAWVTRIRTFREPKYLGAGGSGPKLTRPPSSSPPGIGAFLKKKKH
jgi:hypothetical protein